MTTEEHEKRVSIFESIYFSEIGMCGCGRPEEVKMLIYKLLKNHTEGNKKQVIKETDPDVIFEFIFHVLEKSKLLTHNSSIYSSQITEKGNLFLDLLAEDLGEKAIEW